MTEFNKENAIKWIIGQLDATSKWLIEEHESHNGVWTSDFLDSLMHPMELIGENGAVCPFRKSKESRQTEAEWLYDMVWYESDRGDFDSLTQVFMVLESEWSRYMWDVKYDFEKLLIAKAPLKVFIAEDLKDGGVIKMATAEISAFKTKEENETYLLALYKEEELHFWRCDVKNGSCSFKEVGAKQ